MTAAQRKVAAVEAALQKRRDSGPELERTKAELAEAQRLITSLEAQVAVNPSRVKKLVNQ